MGVVSANRVGRWRKIPPPVVQVDLAVLPVVAEDEVEAPVAVEVSQGRAQGAVAARVDRGDRGGVSAPPVVQIDLARLSRATEHEVEGTVAIQVAQRHARGRERLCLIQIQRWLERRWRQARGDRAALAVIEVNLARFETVAKQDVECPITVDVAQCHALGGDAARIERGGSRDEAPHAVVEVDLARLVIVTEENIEGTVTVEVAQCHAPSVVADGVEREGRSGESTRPVVQIDLARFIGAAWSTVVGCTIIAEENIKAAVAVEVAQRHARGSIASGVDRGGGRSEATQPVVQVDLARRSRVAEQNIEAAVAIEVAQGHARGGIAGGSGVDLDCRGRETTQPIVQVDLAWRSRVTE